jgi:hypothetical protein
LGRHHREVADAQRKELEGQARLLISKVVSHGEFTGQAELIAQVPFLTIVGGPVTFLDLAVDRSKAAPSLFQNAPTPGNAWAVEGDNPLGVILVWVTDGYLSALEFGWVTDSIPTSLPSPEQVRFEP